MIEIKKEIKKELNKMKIIKMIMFVVSISLLTYANAEARDCSNPKGFHEKMMCKMSGQGNMISSETTKTKKVKKAKKERKKSKFDEFNENNKTLVDLLKKD